MPKRSLINSRGFLLKFLIRYYDLTELSVLGWGFLKYVKSRYSIGRFKCCRNLKFTWARSKFNVCRSCGSNSHQCQIHPRYSQNWVRCLLGETPSSFANLSRAIVFLESMKGFIQVFILFHKNWDFLIVFWDLIHKSFTIDLTHFLHILGSMYLDRSPHNFNNS